MSANYNSGISNIVGKTDTTYVASLEIFIPTGMFMILLNKFTQNRNL